MDKNLILHTFSVVWSKCWRERLCVRPFGCTNYVEACVRIIEDLGTYYLEISLLGNVLRYKLTSTCYPAYSLGIATLNVCTNELSIDTARHTIHFHLIVKLCIGKWGVEKCWKLADEPVSISWFTADQLRDRSLGGFEGENIPEIVYVSALD